MDFKFSFYRNVRIEAGTPRDVPLDKRFFFYYCAEAIEGVTGSALPIPTQFDLTLNGFVYFRDI